MPYCLVDWENLRERPIQLDAYYETKFTGWYRTTCTALELSVQRLEIRNRRSCYAQVSGCIFEAQL